MVILLIEELESIGLHLNANKTKILHTELIDEDCTVDYIDIAGELVRVLHGDQWHRYLGRRLSLSSAERTNIDFKYRKQQAWFAFSKHKKIILNKHISLEKILHYFDTCVSPAMLLGLSTFPMLPAQSWKHGAFSSGRCFDT